MIMMNLLANVKIAQQIETLAMIIIWYVIHVLINTVLFLMIVIILLVNVEVAQKIAITVLTIILNALDVKMAILQWTMKQLNALNALVIATNAAKIQPNAQFVALDMDWSTIVMKNQLDNA